MPLKHLKQIKLLTEQSPKNEAPDTCWLIDLEDSGRRIQQKNSLLRIV